MTERFLISVAELREEIAASTAPIVVDASVERGGAGRPSYLPGGDRFADGHIPTAVHADLIAGFSDATSGLSFTEPGAAGLAAAAAALGIHQESPVVVYDVHDGTWAARLWWLLRAYGYGDVRILDGGLRAWKAAGLSAEAGTTDPVVVEPQDATVLQRAFDAFETAPFVDRAAVAAAGDQGAIVVCALKPEVYRGERAAGKRPGHIPGSINVPYADAIDHSTQHHLDPRALVDAVGGLDAHVITYCGGGVNAAGLGFALLRGGARRISVYDGSLSEWTADPDAPLVLGAHPY